MYTYLFVLTYD